MQPHKIVSREEWIEHAGGIAYLAPDHAGTSGARLV